MQPVDEAGVRALGAIGLEAELLYVYNLWHSRQCILAGAVRIVTYLQ